ncbi:MAG: type II-A CRISPR-associated protein Csn2, partial [Streptococcus parasanguinis]|nr:type II-A CRISPR-associated protein Csn2 [Streptococcus parasanguinis]
MKINFPLLDEAITIANATFLVLEDQQVFSDLVKQLYQYTGDSDLNIFDSRHSVLKDSELLVITDILGY